MTITAKFAATCPTCHKAINVGSKIEWSKGARARHASCATPTVASSLGSTPGSRRRAAEAAATPAAAPKRTTGYGVRRQPMSSGHGSAAQVAGYSGYCTDDDYCRCYDCAS